jgi:hypothetical protein
MSTYSQPFAMLSTGASPGDAEREAAATLRRSQNVSAAFAHRYVIRKDTEHPAALRAYDARSGKGISPGMFNATPTLVRRWMAQNFPEWKETD